jgi:hypothetical protein
VQAGGGKLPVAENLCVRLEGGDGAPAVDRAQILQFSDRVPALEPHLVGVLVARHFHVHPFRQGVDHRGAHAMQPAAGVIGLAVEFSAG